MKSKIFIALIALVFLSGVNIVFGQNKVLFLDGEPIDLATGSSVTINPVTGNITAQSQVGTLADVCTEAGVGGSAVAVSPISATPNPVTAGSQVQINWISAGASGCSPTGNLPGWGGQAIGTQGPASFTVPSGASGGAYQAGVECVSGSSSDNSSTTVNVSEPQADPPVINSFQVNGQNTTISNPLVVQPGDNVNVTWSSTNASSCTGTGNFPGWSGAGKPASNSTGQTVSTNTVGNYTLTLTCSGPGGTSSAVTRHVNVQAVNPQCAGVSPPSSMSRRTSGCSAGQPPNPNCTLYESVFLAPFPGTSNGFQMRMRANDYLSFEFETGSTVPTGFVNAQEGQFQAGNGPKIVTISECMGQFDETNLDPRCIWRPAGNVAIEVQPSTGSNPFRCPLQPNTTYYLNITFSTSPAGTPSNDVTWSCDQAQSGWCGNLMTPQFSN